MKSVPRYLHLSRLALFSPARFLLPVLAGFLLCFFIPEADVLAASKPVYITSCKILGKSKVKVTAEVRDPGALTEDRCYLFALGPGQTKIRATDMPSASKATKSVMTFKVDLNRNSTASRVYSLFVIAVKNEDGGFTRVSDYRLISNPQKLAKYTYKFPTPLSKKGLQVNAQMLEDAAELNVKHAAINMVFTEMIAAPSERNQSQSYAFSYHGNTYWYRRSVINSYDRQLKALKETDSVNSAILLLGWRSDLTDLIYPSGRKQGGHAFYAWNTKDAASREAFQAALTFLAKRYSAKNGSHGRIVNWIIGNEVNNYKVYNYAGELSLSSYAEVYAQAFRLASQTLTGIYSHARVYISLDHLWNYSGVSGTFPSRSMLDAFAKRMAKYGGVPWNLAYHPYSSPLTEPKFWENANRWANPALDSPVINMNNLTILTDYIKTKYGKDTRIILSEQGYTSVQYGKKVEKEQAAAIAYSYLLTQSNDMVDSFIMNRHVDHQVEIRQGLSLGIWTTGPSDTEKAASKKYSWKVFKYMDSSRSSKVTKFALKEIGLSGWQETVPDYSKNLPATYQAAKGTLKQVKTYKGKGLPKKWKAYGASSSFRKNGKIFTVFHNNSRNKNVIWGFAQKFSKLSFSKTPNLYLTVKASGSTNQKARLKLRIFSKDNVLEAEKTISTDREYRFKISLKKWKYRSKVTRIQLLLAPSKGCAWNSGAYLTAGNFARG